MKTRPILFNGPMVLALLAGNKGQTRRMVKPQPIGKEVPVDPNIDGPYAAKAWEWKGECPYGQVGDRLWVRESIRLVCGDAEFADSVFMADDSPTKADAWPWKNKVLPSIHCPRGLSRISLEITEIRVQRLHDISEEDARAEGIAQDANDDCFYAPGMDGIGGFPHPADSARGAFALLWDKINGDGCWDDNPIVWAISFRVLVLQ